MGLVTYCKKGYSKIRSDYGTDKIDFKTWLILILCALLFMSYRIYVLSNTKPLIVEKKTIYKEYIYKTDTIKVSFIKKVYLTKYVKTKCVQKYKEEKKVNFSKCDLKIEGINTNTTQKGITKHCKLEIE